MPCRCDGYPEPEPDIHNGPLAEMLCNIMQDHEQSGEMGCFTTDQLAWWEEHKRRDRVRVQMDMSRIKHKADKAAALAKLSPYERHILGL